MLKGTFVKSFVRSKLINQLYRLRFLGYCAFDSYLTNLNRPHGLDTIEKQIEREKKRKEKRDKKI